jgi:hypothetical protein
MTLRRYAPLALSALALACAPQIDERANATTVEYAVFNPSASQIPLPNDIAIQSFLGNPAYAALPCSYFLTPDPTGKTSGLCAYARAGGFPPAATRASIQLQFLTGTLGADGKVAYAPSPLDTGSIAFASLAAPGAANVAVVDATLFGAWVLAHATNPAATPDPGTVVPVAVPVPYDTTTGTLTVSPVAGSWTAGHKYVAVVRGYASGVKTTDAVGYDAMPPLYILREAVIGDLDLSLAENQGLFPGTPAQKMAAGTQLEPLRVGYQGIQQITGALAAFGITIPFAELASMQSFQIAPDATITVGDLDASDPTAAVTGGGTALLDAFTLTSSVATATLTSVTFGLTQGSAALSNLFLSAAGDCTGTPLGTSAAITADTPVAIPFTNWRSVGNTTVQTLYLCANTKTVGAATTVTGGVTVTSANAVGGLVFVAAGSDATSLTVNP